MSLWRPADNCNHSASVSLSVSSIMAVSSPSSHLLILLLISCLDWPSTPASAFLLDRDHMTTSGGLLMWFFVTSCCEDKLAKINMIFRQSLHAAHGTLTDVRQVLLLTLVIASYVRHQLQNALFAQIHEVQRWANAALFWFGLSNRLWSIEPR